MKPARSQNKTPRASVACTKCRLRKVRCDVSRRGHPCMNCELDHEECVVLPRSRMRRMTLESPTSSTNDQFFSERISSHHPSSVQDDDSPDTTVNPVTPSINSNNLRPVDIPFQAYRFIKTDFLSHLPQDEICYLDSQSCFRLPVRASWNRLIYMYFRHINPLLPVINEAAFWEESRGSGAATLSLFVAQAILFAACPFADRRAIKGCGFANCREARAAFYRRAKLLYRLEIERHPISIIKGCLLLSLCSSPQIENPVNSIWLSIAIQHARSMGAHYTKPQGTTLSMDWLQLKQLWWVCLVRDRLIALGHRRPLQISEEDLESEVSIISSEEVSSSLCRSEVHPAPVRQTLLFVFLSFCRLCVPLTRILKLIVKPDTYNDGLDEAASCEETLRGWLAETNSHLESLPVELRGNDLVILHYHIIQIYFHSAYVHILNLKIRMMSSTQKNRSQYESFLIQTGDSIQASVESITDSLSTLEEQGLVGYLPIAAVMCIVLPFVLHSMRVKLIPAAKETAASQKRTDTFLQLIQSLQTRQNNVNPVTNVIEQVLTFIQPRKPMADWKQLISSQPGYYLRILKTLDLALSTGRFPCGKIPVSIPGADQLSDRYDARDEAAATQSEPARTHQSNSMSLDMDLGFDVEDPFRSIWGGEEDFFAFGMNVPDSTSTDPALEDDFGLSRDYDFEAFLDFI